MSKQFIKVVLLIFLLFVSLWDYNSLSKESKSDFRINTPSDAVLRVRKNSKVSKLSLTGKYTCLMDAKSKRILYDKNSSKKVPMASTTKIMTCLIALEKGKLSDLVTVSNKAASMPKVHLGMKAGEKYQLKDLLYSLILMSHNDTAVAIAEHVGGSLSGFALAMNKKAKELGMNDTSFVTPNGLDADAHYSTAKDMCILAAYAIKNKKFLEIVNTPSYHFLEQTSKKEYQVNNKDAFLSMYEGALGLKTGFTNRAGYCFVGAAVRQGTYLVSCTLACGWPPKKTAKWRDTIAMMNYGYQFFHSTKLEMPELSRYNIRIRKGEKSSVSLKSIPEDDILLGDQDEVSIHFHIPKEVIAPVSNYAPIGTCSLYINDRLFKIIRIYPEESVRKIILGDCFLDILHRFCCKFS